MLRSVAASLEMCNGYNLVGGIVNHAQFKKMHLLDRTSKGAYTRNALIASITKIEHILSNKGEELTRVEFGDHGNLGILLLDSYNARMRKLKGPWRGYGYHNSSKGLKGNHIVITIQNVDFTLEALLLLVDDIEQNNMLVSYSNVHANVLDGTGSLENLWNTKPNMDIENIEWCLPSDNLRHGRNIAYMKECCNDECYSFSVHDGQIMAMLELRDIFTKKQVHLYAKQKLKRTL